MISVIEAQQIILDSATPLGTHLLPIERAISYVLVDDIKADRPIPPFDRVAMDGFAVRSSDFISQTATLEIKGKIQTGIAQNLEVNSGETIKVMTGSPCPPGADAVVKVEQSSVEGNQVVLTEEKMKSWLNLAKKGEDAAEGTVLISSKTSLTASGIAVCASVGIPEVNVFQKPQIKIISTGTEIISPFDDPLPHQIRDCNSYALRAMCKGLKIEAEFLGIGEDDTDVIGDLIQKGLEADILILSGGVSMGEYDHVPKVLSAHGIKKIFHKINMKPGKPLWFGKSESGTFVFGLPGNPVSAQTCFRLFVEPLIKKLSGSNSPKSMVAYFPLFEDVISKTSREHYIPVQLYIQDGRTFLKPIIIRGSGDFSNLVKSHGLMRCPSDIDLMKQETFVEFLPWTEIW